MAETTANIVINAVTTAAQKAIGALGGTASSTGSALKAFGSAGATAMKGLGAAVVVLNQGFELAKKGAELLSRGFEQTIGKALEFRKGTDPAVKFFKDMQRESELVRARLGDALMPVLMGVMQAFNSVSGSISKTIQQNQKLIGLNLISWGKSVALMLINGIAGALIIATKGWAAFREGATMAQSVISQAMAAVANVMAGTLETFAGLADAFGKSDLSARLLEAATAANQFGEEMVVAGDKSFDSLGEATLGADKTLAKIEAMRESATAFADQAEANAIRLVNANRTGMNVTATEHQAHLTQKAGAEKVYNDLLTKWKTDQAQYHSELQEKMTVETIAANKAMADSATDFASTMGQAMGEQFASIMLGTQTVSEAFQNMGRILVQNVIQIATKTIMAYAAMTAAQQFAAHAYLPFVGIVIGAAAAATAFGLVGAFVDKFATGGEVTGGTPGRDSVLASLTPGERVLTVGENRQLKSLMRSVAGTRQNPGASPSGIAPAAFASGGEVPSGGGGAGGGVTLNLSVNALELPPRAQMRKFLMSASEDFDNLVRDGFLLRGFGVGG